MQVFISHVQSDAEMAEEISKYLKDQGFQVFDPATELAAGDNWHLEIGKALETSQAMVVLLSPESARSRAVQGEIEYALGSKRFKGRVIPVEVEPTKDVPWILRRFQYVRLQDSPEEAGRQVVRALKLAGEPDVYADAH
jgi:TIR domain